MIQLERNHKQWVGSLWKYPHLKAGHWRPNDASGMVAVVACSCGSSYALRTNEVDASGISGRCSCGEKLQLLNWGDLPEPLPTTWGDIKKAVEIRR